MNLDGVRGLIIDLDGVVLRGAMPIEGAAGALDSLTESGVPFVVLSNRTDPSKARLLTQLRERGIGLPVERLLCGVDAIRGYLAARPRGPCYPLTSDGFREDLVAAEVPITAAEDAECAYVVVGANCAYDPRRVAGAVQAIRNGARLIGVNRVGLRVRANAEAPVELGPGFLIAGLEQVTDTRATLVGKPAPAFFSQALERLDVPAAQTLVVGDRLREDIEGARAAGCRAIHISETHSASDSSPSLAEVVGRVLRNP